MERITVTPLTFLERMANHLVDSAQRMVGMDIRRTHVWNNVKVAAETVAYLSKNYMVHHEGLPHEPSFGTLRGLRAHLPFTGWRHYVAIEPRMHQLEPWYVGWIAEDVIGYSQLPLRGPVRVLVGPGPTRWFGITETGRQIVLQKQGEGRIGGDIFDKHFPLL